MAVTVDILIIGAVIVSALWAVMTRSLLRAAIGLAITSAAVSVLMFRLDSPLAAVFELSVCSGLISVLFISTISLTQPMTREEKIGHMQDRFQRFKYLPLVILAAIIGFGLLARKLQFHGLVPPVSQQVDTRSVLWHSRPLDMVGQIAVLLAGAFGVVILFKERRKK